MYRDRKLTGGYQGEGNWVEGKRREKDQLYSDDGN